MNRYRLFGGILATDIDIPELPSITTVRATWRLTSSPPPPDSEAGELLGTDSVTGDVQVRLFRHGKGFRLTFDDTGSFDIAPDGARIHWWRPAGVSLDDARSDLTGRVLAAALHAAETMCLHGSAVVADGTAVAFLAPKFHGKSTTALALVRAGARLLTDDTLPVSREGDVVVARPGLHATRLWRDSAARVALGQAQPAPDGHKQLYSGLPEECVTHDACPLDALYVLAPARADAGRPAAVRTRLAPTQAALLMIAHGKLAPLVRGSESACVFQRAASLASRVPMYRLDLMRDLDRLDEVVETLMGWHRAGAFA